MSDTEKFGASMKRYKGVQGGVYHLVQSMDQFWEFYRELEKQRAIAVDTETSGLDWVHDHACGIVIGWGVEYNFYLPIAMVGWPFQLDLERIREPLSKVLGSVHVVKVFWNEKFDRHFLAKAGISTEGVRHDGVTLLHLLDENTDKTLKGVSKKHISHAADKWEKMINEWRTNEAKRRRKAYAALVTSHLSQNRAQVEADCFESEPLIKFSGLTKVQITARLKKWVRENALHDHPLAKNKKDEISYDCVPEDIMTPYACADVHYTYLMYKRFLVDVASHQSLKPLYFNETQVAALLYEVERHGIKVDVDYLRGLVSPYEKKIAALEQEIYADVGRTFDIGSNPQLIAALLSAGCKLTKLTKRGKDLQNAGQPIEPKHFSVDAQTLEALAVKYSFAQKIIDYRGLLKLLNTYIVKIADLVDDDHYLHSSFNPNVATGRMSSREPNVQNIPGKDKAIRKAFTIPDVDMDPRESEWLYLLMDYSQVELRLTAHWSKDPTFLAAYPWDGPASDVHSITCADAVMRIPLDEFLQVYENDKDPDFPEYKWFRNIAKRVNFGIIYGASESAIQRQVSTPTRPVELEACKAYIDGYFEKYRGVKDWINRTTFGLGKTGYLQNTFGRYRRLPDSQARERWMRARAGRQGVNFLIQGDAADLFKHAAVRVHNFLRQQKARTKIVNFVHDEIQFYLHKKELDLIPQIKELMEDFPQFCVPIVVDVEYAVREWAKPKAWEGKIVYE